LIGKYFDTLENCPKLFNRRTPLKGFLSSAPVLAAVWMTITAGVLIEANRLFPDTLTFPF
jgi:photosystem I subunit 9